MSSSMMVIIAEMTCDVLQVAASTVPGIAIFHHVQEVKQGFTGTYIRQQI